MSTPSKEDVSKARELCVDAANAHPLSPHFLREYRQAIKLVGFDKAEDLLNEAKELRKILGA